MNENTLISVHCYDGDSDRVRMLMPVYEHHGAPVVILSPSDSPVHIEPHIGRQAGLRAYIGAPSLERQIQHLKILLEYPFEFFLLNDSDSFCVSAEIPRQLYEQAEDTLWANNVVEPRPHESPYPKLACQPPYFLTRRSIEKILAVAPTVPCHPITPYIDWAMCAWSCEAGLRLRAFTDLEHPTDKICVAADPWEILSFRVQYQGAVMMHPIKDEAQRNICVGARALYEQFVNRG